MLLLHCVHTYLFISTRSRRSIPVLSDSVDHTLTYPSTAGSCSHALGDQARAVIRLIVVFKWTCRADVSGRSFKPGGHSVHADPYVSMLVVVHAPGYRAGGLVEGTDRRHIFKRAHACPSYLHSFFLQQIRYYIMHQIYYIYNISILYYSHNQLKM